MSKNVKKRKGGCLGIDIICAKRVVRQRESKLCLQPSGGIAQPNCFVAILMQTTNGK